MRNYLTTFRNDIDYSSQFAIMEDKFIRMAGSKGQGETFFQLDTKEKILLDNFMLARGKGLLLNRSSMDKNGKSTISDPATGRPVNIGAGIIPQIERFASKSVYVNFMLETLNTALRTLNRKAEKPQGNTYNLIVNEILYADINRVLGDYLAKFKTDGSFMYSMKANGFVKVNPMGYDSYNYLGNSINITVDRALTEEYPDRGFGIIVDLTSDAASGTPAMAQFTVKDSQFIQNTIAGVGGLDGNQSGAVATPVAGSKKVIMGVAGVCVFNPYRSYIIRQA